jgi:sugar phosphate permease
VVFQTPSTDDGTDARREHEQGASPAVATSRAHGMITSASAVFWLMLGINVANYLDRFIAVAVAPTLKAEFHLTDHDIGLLTSAFLLIYTVAAIPLGLLADRVSRPLIVAGGVAVWSVASVATAFVGGFAGLVATRAAVGIGEASYYPAGTALLSDYFPREARARVMSRWGAGQLVGIALAFALGGIFSFALGSRNGWRAAFLCAGLPGIALAVAMGRVADTPSRATAGAPATAGREPAHSALSGVRAVLRIRTVWLVIVLQALLLIATTPSIAFLAIYVRSPSGPYHLRAGAAALLIGVVVILGGISGQILGGTLADLLDRHFTSGRIWAAAFGFLAGLPCFVLMLMSQALLPFAIFGTLAVLALTLPSGPLTAAAQDATPPALRATAVAIILLLSHLLGDVWSPTVVGSISTALHERTGLALLIVGVPTLALGGIIGVWGTALFAHDLAARAGQGTAR